MTSSSASSRSDVHDGASPTAAGNEPDIGSVLDVLMFGFRRVREQLDATAGMSAAHVEAKDAVAARIAVDALVQHMPSTFLDELGTTAAKLVDLVVNHAAAMRERPSLN